MKLKFLEVPDCSLKANTLKFKLLELSAVQGHEINDLTCISFTKYKHITKTST